jgi:hypothetical protein
MKDLKPEHLDFAEVEMSLECGLHLNYVPLVCRLTADTLAEFPNR